VAGAPLDESSKAVRTRCSSKGYHSLRCSMRAVGYSFTDNYNISSRLHGDTVAAAEEERLWEVPSPASVADQLMRQAT